MASVNHASTQILGSDAAWRQPIGLFWLCLAILGMGVFFWDGIIRVVDGWSRPEYSFGPLVPVVSAYMLLFELRERPPRADGGSRFPGLLVVGLGLLIGLIGNLTQISHIIAFGLIVTVGGLALILAGFRQGIQYWPGWVHLLFLVPLPSFVFHKLSASLQLISSEIGVAIVQAAGIPVYLTGNIIDLGIYQLQVAEACSGLRYLFPLMSFGYLFAVLYRGPVWQKFVLFFLSIPITVLMNSVRIGVIGILVNSYGIGYAEGFLHWFEGWVIFISCTILLYLSGILLQRLRREPASNLNILDLDFDGLFKPLGWLRTIPATSALVGAATVILISGLLWQLTPSRAAPLPPRETLDVFPMSIGDWRGQRSYIDDQTLTVLKADEYVLADYRIASGTPPVELFIAYYYSITDGTDTHTPEKCIPGGGWEVSRWRGQEVDPGGGKLPFAVNRATIQLGSERRLVYYWYEQRGHHFASSYDSKFNTVVDAALLGRSDGALVRLVTPLPKGEPEAEADRRLQDFVKKLMPTLPKYLPD